jgi:hypothetical protein
VELWCWEGRQGRNFAMGSITQPFGASGPRLPAKRPRGIPPAVQAAALLMIHEKVDFVTAAKANNLAPDTMRRWLNRGELVSFIRRESASFCHAICTGNVRALQEIRDSPGGNAVAKVNSIKQLEDMNERSITQPGERATPGVTIRILNVNSAPAGPPSSFVAVSSHGLPNQDE